jgi:hypothetical protein
MKTSGTETRATRPSFPTSLSLGFALGVELALGEE